jgi:predicted dehydrogenase/threonine dehydrogenase-like Zn-dependent dehydrogenase
MRQIAQNYKTGELTVLQTPQPTCRPGGLLVGTAFSLISTGTEMMKVHEAQLSLLGKARARPDQVRKVVDSVAQQGPRATYAKAMERLDSFTPLGYSTCGRVLEVGAGVDGYAGGDLVACAGNEYALHADVNWVPKNLCVPVPDEVEPPHAAFATVGAIAMQGLRQAQVQLGETACVIGLGLIGQLLARLLRASGVTVLGLDPVSSRRELAVQAGAVSAGDPSGGLDAFEREVTRATGGLGVDHVFLVAGGSSNQPVETAARLARDRGRIVDIGKTRLDLPWNAYYEKELDVRFSRSYGPGRYDDTYELQGIDYPAGYVRWTQRRNLESFLDLAAQGRLDLSPLVSGVFSVDDAPTVYRRLEQGELTGVGYLFRYEEPTAVAPPSQRAVSQAPPVPTTPSSGGASRRRRTDAVRVGFVGAGNYASSMLLPHLARDEQVRLARVATARPLSAVNAARKFGFDSISTDSSDVLEDESLDAVFIVTRHHSHADLVCRALATGRAVYVEKPLALRAEQLEQVLHAVETTGNDRLMVGFNRRFAPLLTALRDGLGDVGPDAVARYLVNAGRLTGGSWYADSAREGSRFVGEGGHFIDTLSALLGDEPVQVFAAAVPNGEDLDVRISFRRGALASVTYTTSGSPRFAKETIDVSTAGRTARLDNYHRATVWRGGTRRTKRSFAGQDKGQPAMVRAFLASVRSGGPMPIPLSSLVRTTRATLAVDSSLSAALPVPL